MNIKLYLQGLALITMLVSSQLASSATFNLCAGITTLTMPDSTIVTMWGYGIDDSTPNCDSATIPGPQLDVPIGDNLLDISLRNTLSVSSSIIVPGLANTVSPVPVYFTDSQGRQRARAMTKEVAPGGIDNYTFTATPGTYLYHSGSHPAVQVQMGLYGGVTKDAALNEAYAGVSYNNQIVLLYSEIDPSLHSAVVSATYGTPTYPTTIGYKPRYFLINGAPYTSATPDISAGSTNQTSLLRFINAGLESHVPVIQSGELEIVAEYGSQYPYSRKQNSFLLAAGQTKDVLFKAEIAAKYALFDRRLRLTNNLQSNGGLMSFLDVNASATDPVSVLDSITTDEDVSLNALDLAFNDTDIGGILDLDSIHIPFQPSNGIAVANNNGTGTVTYTPNSDFNGVDTFSYTIKDNLGNVSNLSDVVVTINPISDAPVANDDTYNVVGATTLNINAANGVLLNDLDVDEDAITASLQTDVTNGVLNLNADGSFTYTPSLGATIDSFTYIATDTSTAISNIATVTIIVNTIPLVTLVSPIGDIGANNTPTHVWNAVSSATEYKLYIKDPSGIITQLWYSSNAASCANGELTCSIVTITQVANGTYRWKVRARNLAGLGPWTTLTSYIIGVPPSAPTLIAPTGGIGGNNLPTFTWNAQLDVVDYRLWYRDSAGTVIQALHTPTETNCENGETTCTFTPTVSLVDGDYSWKVKTRNVAGLGPWSTRLRFYVGLPPIATVALAPSGNVVLSSPAYSWNSVSNATNYQLKLRNAAGTNIVNKNYTPAQAGCDSGQPTCSITPATALSNDTYRWMVKTKNNGGQGPWSNELIFTKQ